MPLLKYRKPIGCLEGDWFPGQDRLSVLRLLEFLEASLGCPYVHRQCSTEPELDYQLTMLGRRRSYGLIYLAFHGTPGSIETGGGHCSMTLEQLSEKLGRRFAGRVLHFASCSTLSVPEGRIRRFQDETGAAVVSGYRDTVDWLDAAAFDLLYLGLWQTYKSPGAFNNRLQHHNAELVQRVGFVTF